MHGELGAFAHRTRNQTQADQGAQQGADGAIGFHLGGPGIKVFEIEGSSPGGQGHHTHQQQHITHALGEERIPGCGDHQGLGIPKAHQQIGGEGEHLEHEVAQEQIAAQHHASHGPLKEAEQGVEAGQGPLLIEIAEGKHLPQQAHDRDELQGRQVGEAQVKANAQIKPRGFKPRPLDHHPTVLLNPSQDQAAVGNAQHGHQQV